MRNISGAPVESENFFGREDDCRRLRELLIDHDILLLGPRRIGKTSIARKLMAEVLREGWHAVEVNVADCKDEAEFLRKLENALTPALASIADKLTDSTKAAFTSVMARIKSFKISLQGMEVALTTPDTAATAPTTDWLPLANELLQLVAKATQNWLIYIDELPIFLFNLMREDAQHGVQRVRRFLDWFRNDMRAMPALKTVRWLVSGSVGLDTLVQQHGMADTINSMKHEALAAFSDQIAADMLAKLAEHYQIHWTPAYGAQLTAAVLWPQPYYLQLAFYQLRTLLAAHPLPPSQGAAAAHMENLIQRAVQQMAEPGVDNDFHHWEQRLRMQLSLHDANHCLALLTLAAETAQGARAETLFAKLQERLPNASSDEAKTVFVQLRDILQRDAYWWPDESSGSKRYRFRLEPLRLWWLRRNTI